MLTPARPRSSPSEAVERREPVSLVGGRPLRGDRLSGSGRNPLERYRKRRLSRVERLEILHKLLARDVPAIVVRQEIQRRRVFFRISLEEDTEVRVTDAAEHEARHCAGSYLRSGSPGLSPSSRATTAHFHVRPLGSRGKQRFMAVRMTTATLQVQVSESASVGDLKSYLEATECEVQVLDTHTLEVSIPRVHFPAQALRVLTLHLAGWRALNPGTDALIVD
jgi:hypothetical protein